MRNLHGVSTEVEERRYQSNIYPDLNSMSPNAPSNNGVESLLGAMVPTLKTISATGGKYIEVNRMKANPGRKEVEEGIEELKVILATDGRWETGKKKISLDAYGHVTTRMKELVHESDHPEMERAYSQLSGRKWERGHELLIEHMEKAIREVINKSSAENAIKKFSEFRFSKTRGISNQVIDMANMVDEFFHEEMQVVTYKKKQMEKVNNSRTQHTHSN